ncbi:uncharacterized protein UV8b_05218 [Ustilaginoidea virens]|uniref:Helix-turn-helix-domain containing protein type n=1 Tax=Ustilaginoidea virens TaxID=1159556 RepID=A0A063BTA6_USTVR|nr:uncharacterized protein UV8b_05218 [Ustilaginoidea virens]QUC20977.1 hypothetical protein UV8b_05218 [Ustilaginoidea virens]GAO20008.1 hypothetical protein UVI_02008570 [Ustilaginoidea virens]
MSTYTFYDASIPIIREAVESLEAILKKGEQAPNAASFPEARIYEDMLPLSFQVHFSTDLALKFIARASGTEPLSTENNFKTFADFYKRIDQTKEALANADKDLINKRVDETITIGLGPKNGSLLVRNYLSGYVLPNIFFHITTAYNIMRKEGVPLGKMDFITPFLTKHLTMV